MKWGRKNAERAIDLKSNRFNLRRNGPRAVGGALAVPLGILATTQTSGMINFSELGVSLIGLGVFFRNTFATVMPSEMNMLDATNHGSDDTDMKHLSWFMKGAGLLLLPTPLFQYLPADSKPKTHQTTNTTAPRVSNGSKNTSTTMLQSGSKQNCEITVKFPSNDADFTPQQTKDAIRLVNYLNRLVLPNGKQLDPIPQDQLAMHDLTTGHKASLNIDEIQHFAGIEPAVGTPWNKLTCLATAFGDGDPATP